MPTDSRFGPIADMILPFISANKVKTGDGKVNIGPGGLLGMQDVSGNYLDYINKRERERLMTPMARKMHYLQANLARRIGREMGMTPEQATLAATRVSAPSVMAWGLMKANNVDSTLGKFEKAMRDMGVISPVGLKGADKSTRAYNERMQRVMGEMVQMVMDPKLSHRWGNMTSDEITDIIIPRLMSGEYNDIIQNPKAYDRTGLSRQAKASLFNKMTNTTRAVNELQYLFPGSSPQEAYAKMSSYFGGDPIKALGADNTKKLFQELRSTARATGISQDDVVNLMANIGSEYRKSGRDPYHALSSARDFMILGAASRKGPGDIDPGKYNQAMIANVAAARHSNIADSMGQVYAALTDRVGADRAEKIIDDVSKNQDNIKNSNNFLKAVNNKLYAYRARPLTEDLLETYKGNDKVNYFKASGIGTMTLLKHYGDQIQNYRKKLLQRKFGWDDDQIRYLEQMGGPTLGNVTEYYKKMGFSNPDTARKKAFQVQQAFDELAKNQGFEKALSADRFLTGINNKNALKRYNSAIKRAERVAQSLEKRPRPGGIRGLTQYLGGNKTSGNWWEALTGSQTLSPQQVAEMQGVDLKKFDKNSQKVWENALKGWLSPETTPNKQRTKAFEDISRMAGS